MRRRPRPGCHRRHRRRLPRHPYPRRREHRSPTPGQRLELDHPPPRPLRPIPTSGPDLVAYQGWEYGRENPDNHHFAKLGMNAHGGDFSATESRCGLEAGIRVTLKKITPADRDRFAGWCLSGAEGKDGAWIGTAPDLEASPTNPEGTP